MAKFRSPRGTHDILPDEAAVFRRVYETSRRVFEHSGYREIITPMFEEKELFARSVGAETDIVKKEMYVFEDRGGRILALRPEGTASVIRSYLQHGLHAAADIQKLYYLGPMFRYDRPAAGRYRQFHQVGTEAIGSMSPYLDVETIFLLRELSIDLGITRASMHLNSVGCRECRPGYIGVLKGYLGDRLDQLCGDCRTRFEVNPLRMLDCKNESCQAIYRDTPLIIDHLCEECEGHFDEVRAILTATDIPFVLNPRLVRGLDYYTKTAFELVPDAEAGGSQSSLGGGGRYDELVEMLGGAPTPAVGFSAGVERLVTALEELGEKGEGAGADGKPDVDVFFVVTDEETRRTAFRSMFELRNRVRIDMDHSGKSVKAQFRLANRLGVSLTVVFGGDELKRGVVNVKDMESGDEFEVPLSELGTRLAEIRTP